MEASRPEHEFRLKHGTLVINDRDDARQLPWLVTYLPFTRPDGWTGHGVTPDLRASSSPAEVKRWWLENYGEPEPDA